MLEWTPHEGGSPTNAVNGGTTTTTTTNNNNNEKVFQFAEIVPGTIFGETAIIKGIKKKSAKEKPKAKKK
jgi:hypothetical protein